MNLLLRVVLAAMLVAASSGCSVQRFVRKIQQYQDAPNREEQRAMLLARDNAAMAALKRRDLGICLGQDKVSELLTPDVIEELNDSASLKKEQIRIHRAATSFQPGAIELQLTFEKEYQGVVAVAEAAGMVAVSAARDTIAFSASLDSFKVVGARKQDPKVNLDALVGPVNAAIQAALDLINGAIDVHFNQTGRAIRRIVVPKLISTDASTFSRDGGVVFAPKQIELLAHIARSALLIDKQGLCVMAEITSTPPSASSETMVVEFDAPLEAIDFDTVFAKYRAEFISQFQQSFGDEFAAPLGTTSAVLTKRYIAQTLNTAINAAPKLCGKGTFSAAPPPFNKDIFVPTPEKKQCASFGEVCSYKDACSDPDECKETVGEVVDGFCPGSKAETICDDVFGWLGKVVKRVCRVVTTPITYPCKLTRKVVVASSKLACKALSEFKKIDPGICTIAANVEKARCDVFNADRVAICAAEEGLREILSRSPVANVAGTVSATGSFDACIDSLDVNDSFSQASLKVSGNGAAAARLRMKFDNKLPPGIGLCRVDWAHDFDVDAQVAFNQEAFQLTLGFEQRPSAVALTLTSGAKQIHTDLSKSPLDTVFLRHPDLLVNCEPLVVAAVGFVAYQTVVKEHLKKLSPYATGKSIPLDVKPFHFEVEIGAIKVEAPGKQELELKPRLGALAFGYYL